MYIVSSDKKYNLILANTFFKRLKGFMFKKNIDYVISFNKTNSIHTFFMRENIDVIMTNKNNKILYIFKDFKRNKIILPKKNVYYTYEFPSNSTNYKINDYIKIEDN